MGAKLPLQRCGAGVDRHFIAVDDNSPNTNSSTSFNLARSMSPSSREEYALPAGTYFDCIIITSSKLHDKIIPEVLFFLSFSPHYPLRASCNVSQVPPAPISTLTSTYCGNLYFAFVGYIAAAPVHAAPFGRQLEMLAGGTPLPYSTVNNTHLC